jgi:DNA-binding transcriptional MerR regulator
MSQANKAPAYNLKVVLQLTGIKPDTLRAWERRYGLPLPQRTAGGHRLYSKHDIEMIKWLMVRQDEGMRINRAIDLWRDIEAGGKDPLDELNPVGKAEVFADQPLITGSSLEEIRDNWVDACLAYNESSAERILSQSFALYPVELVCMEVLQRGVVEIGERWYQGDVTVQQEHFASGLVLRRLEALIAASPTPTRSEKIVIGCPAQEEHVMAALMTTLFLRRHGWEVVYLGANVPLADLETAVISTKARLLILIASQLHTAANLYVAARALRDVGIPLAFAGSIFTRQIGLGWGIPGYYLGDRLDRVIQEVEAVLKHPFPAEDVHMPRNDYREAKIKIEDRQSMIKAEIWNELGNNDMKEHTLQVANEALMQDILSALTLSNLDSLQMEIDWVGTLIEHQALPNSLLPEYLRVFANSIDRQAGEAGRVVSDWLRTAASKQEMR